MNGMTFIFSGTNTSIEDPKIEKNTSLSYGEIKHPIGKVSGKDDGNHNLLGVDNRDDLNSSLPFESELQALMGVNLPVSIPEKYDVSPTEGSGDTGMPLQGKGIIWLFKEIQGSEGSNPEIEGSNNLKDSRLSEDIGIIEGLLDGNYKGEGKGGDGGLKDMGEDKGGLKTMVSKIDSLFSRRLKDHKISTEDLMKRVEEFLQSSKERPFFLIGGNNGEGNSFEMSSHLLQNVKGLNDIIKQPHLDRNLTESVGIETPRIIPNPNSNHLTVSEVSKEMRTVTGNRVFDHNLIEQISNKIGISFKDGFGKATIKLEPPSLGHLKVDIIIKDNIVRASIATEHPVVKEVIGANLNSLKDSLMEQGLKVDQLMVCLGDRSDDYHGWYEENGSSGGGDFSLFNADNTTTLEWTWHGEGRSGIDLYI